MRWVIFNQKGGVGKSTIVCNLAAASALDRRRTLVVDLDPQANASHYLLGTDFEVAQPSLAEFSPSMSACSAASLGSLAILSPLRSWRLQHPLPSENCCYPKPARR